LEERPTHLLRVRWPRLPDRHTPVVISPLDAISTPRSSKLRLIVHMRHFNKWSDVPKFVFEGLHKLKDIMSKGDHLISYEIEIQIEIEIVYNLYRVKPVAVYGPSQLCHVGNL
jgi:hypothetical protein